jgi:hypothetical protein
MDTPASPPAPGRPSIKERLTRLERRIKDLQLDLKDTVELIERLRENCLLIKAKLTETEQEYALLVKEAERL